MISGGLRKRPTSSGWFLGFVLAPIICTSSCGSTKETAAPIETQLNTDSAVTADFDEQVNRYLALSTPFESSSQAEKAAKEAAAARAAEAAKAADADHVARAAAQTQAEKAVLARATKAAEMAKQRAVPGTAKSQVGPKQNLDNFNPKDPSEVGAECFFDFSNGQTVCGNFIPTVTINSNRDPGPTGNANITLTFTFSEAVTGFTASDVLLTNASAGAFTAVSSSVYTLAVIATGTPVSALVPDDVANDTAGDGNRASNLLSLTYVRTFERCGSPEKMPGWLPPFNNYGKPIKCTCPKGKVYFALTGHCIDLNEFPKRPLLTQGRMLFNPKNGMCYGAVNPISIDILLANHWEFSDLNCRSRTCQPIPRHLLDRLVHPSTGHCYTPMSTCELDDLIGEGWKISRHATDCRSYIVP